MNILEIDIETAPHRAFTWGLFNQNLSIDKIIEPGYTLCFSAKWFRSPNTMFFSIFHDGQENMIDQAWRLLHKADAVIHYNGAKFDIPTLNREFLLQGMTPPEPYKQIDLLTTVKREFRLASNKLDFVCQELGIGSKVQHKGMELWKECMENDPDAWETMKEYNKRDVTLLEDLYLYLRPWIRNHPNFALYDNTDRPCCTNCGSTRLHSRGKQHNTNTQSYRRFQCLECGTWVRERFTSLPKEQRQNVLVRAT